MGDSEFFPRTASMIVMPGGASERSGAQDDPLDEYAPTRGPKGDEGRLSSIKGRGSARRGPLDSSEDAA